MIRIYAGFVGEVLNKICYVQEHIMLYIEIEIIS